jgi:hypothetical protein
MVLQLYASTMKKKAGKKREGNPVVMFRLPPAHVKELDRLSKAFGYSDRSAFLREFVGVCISADTEKAGVFLQKIFQRAAEAAQAKLPGILDQAQPRKRGTG